MKAILSFVITLSMAYSSLMAQLNPGNFTISAVNSAGLIKVLLTPLNNTVVPPGQTYYNDLSFTIYWPASYTNVDLDMSTLVTNYDIVSSGPRFTSGTGASAVNFRSFNRGGASITQLPSGWPANVPVILMTIENNYASTTAPFVGDFCIFDHTAGVIHPVQNPALNIDARPNVFVVDFNDPGNPIADDYTPSVTGCATAVPLPLELVNFEASPGKDAINLRWQTAKEENFSGFELERSLDGLKFERVTFLAGRGNQKGAFYQFDDRSVSKGVNYYYRLKMLDKDGKYEYSGIRSAIIPTSNINVVIYPNPSNGNVNLDFVLEESAPTIIDVYDMNGRNVLRREFDAHKDRNMVSLDLLDQTSGVYSIQININGKLINKLVKITR